MINELTHYSSVLLFYTPMKHHKTQRFSDVFKEYRKATPGCNGLNIGFLKFTVNGENKSIDQSKISYYANHGSRQWIKSKPIWVGFNIWVLVEAYGYVRQVEPYQSVKKGKQVASSTT